MSACICEFPESCGGEGVLYCEGCGGDICVCAACNGAGEMECPGCDECPYDEDWDDWFEDVAL
jgi:hypothetical protein